MSEQQQSYISRVHLKRYKSIRDTEITFQPGLNIIIGPNGSGKTNFLEFLWKVTHFEYFQESVKFESEIDFFGRKDFAKPNSYQKFTHTIKTTPFSNGRKEAIKVLDSINGIEETEIIENDIRMIANIQSYNAVVNALYPITQIKHGIPNILGLDKQLSFDYLIEKVEGGISTVHTSGLSSKLNLLNVIFGQHLKAALKNSLVNNEYDKVTRASISKSFNSELEELNSFLQIYTPIEKVRLSPGLLVKKSSELLKLCYITLEFCSQGEWVSWDFLSDGTKRLFYIISEVYINKRGIILLEEPELGIHPDQLNKLMLFLKQQSEEKQIIITTHSPQVLNILEKDELNRLIICRHEGEKGTKMVHLSDEEQQWAKEYMLKEPLSEYWTYLGIEAEQIDD